LDTLTSAQGPVRVSQVSPRDLEEVFGSPLPALKVALVAATAPDAFVSTRATGDPAHPGSAIGASSQIQALGSNLAGLSRPGAGNPGAGWSEFGDPGSYQSTLNASTPGSLGDNVAESVESEFKGASLRVPVYQVRFNPYAGGGPSRTLVGAVAIQADGRLTYEPQATARK